MGNAFKSVLASGGTGTGVHVDTLTITTQPTTKAFILGEVIDTTGMVVTASASGMSGTVTQYCTVSPQILDTAGEQVITVSYGDATTTYTVNVYAVETVTITSQPTNRVYMYGDNLNLSGIAVRAVAGTITKDVTNICTYSPANGTMLTTSGTNTITASFGGQSDTTTVTCYAIEQIEITTPPDKLVYGLEEYLDLTGMVVTATAGIITRNITSSCSYNPANGTYLDTEGTFTLTASYLSYSDTLTYEVIGFGTLEQTLWARIQQIAALGTGAQYWSVGDTKTVTLNGTVGTLALANFVCKVFIIDFNHDNVNGIYFQGFKSNDATPIDIALCDSYYNTEKTDGTKAFNINHTINKYENCFNYGGWKGCDLRYDILGSTNVAPSEYNQIKTSANVGYDATNTCATNPVENTLMSCLPSSLRNVLAPWTIYCDNNGASSPVITTSIDYLPLMSEKELFGTGRNGESYSEWQLETQMGYYQNLTTNYRKKYNHSNTGIVAKYYLRSPLENGSKQFTGYEDGAISPSCQTSQGLAPMFRVA